MTLESATKVPLKRVNHTVRASQAVLQYCIGAMVDFRDQTLMTAAPEYWADKVVEIHDERLEKLLHVDYFGMPGDKDDSKFSEGISYTRFPSWYFCPKCREFKQISKWVREYRKKAKTDYEKEDWNMVGHMQCPKCKQDLVVARIVTVCDQGHIDDFPWVKWVHYKNINSKEKKVCSNPDLRFTTGTSATEGLEGLIITCENCKARASLKDAFGPYVFSNIDNELGINEFKCTGFYPWKNKHEKCNLYPRSMQRGSSSVYFPVTVSSLVIPPYSSLINKKIEDSQSYRDCRNAIAEIVSIDIDGITDEMKEQIKKKKINEYVDKISLEIGIYSEQVKVILERKWCDNTKNEPNPSLRYKAEEYEALNGEISINQNQAGDFLREEMDITKYDIPYIKGISLIHKVREVQALVGFSRINPVTFDFGVKDNKRMVNVKEPNTRWYPGYQVRGEGIFIEFDNQKVSKWIRGNSELEKHVSLINDNYKKSFIGGFSNYKISPKFLLLHTLSHLLIKQLSFECGYSIASLKERIYSSEEEECRQMAGILIYTASGDSEGTMGGLVRQGMPDCFENIFKKAMRTAMVCSNDPVCILSNGQGMDSLNLAACHACTLLPETCCEFRNVFLDRSTVVGTFKNKSFGFYSSQLYDDATGWDNQEEQNNTLNDQDSNDIKQHIVVLDDGIDMSDAPYMDIWNAVGNWVSNEKCQCTIKELCDRVSEVDRLEKPIYGGHIKLLETDKELEVDLVWKSARVILFSPDHYEEYKVAIESDWKCIYLSDPMIDASAIITILKG